MKQMSLLDVQGHTYVVSSEPKWMMHMSAICFIMCVYALVATCTVNSPILGTIAYACMMLHGCLWWDSMRKQRVRTVVKMINAHRRYFDV